MVLLKKKKFPPFLKRGVVVENNRLLSCSKKDSIQRKSTTMNTIISVKDLVKNYGSFNAVKGISFDVFEGEIFGLLGPNGAGKSTTLEIMETLREKTSGQVTVCGMDLDKQPDDIKKVIGVQL